METRFMGEKKQHWVCNTYIRAYLGILAWRKNAHLKRGVKRIVYPVQVVTKNRESAGAAG